MTTELLLKDPDAIEPFFVVWCGADGTNDGSANDEGELQGATIDTATWIVPAGITNDNELVSAVTINGVTYAANTVATIWLSGGSDYSDYRLTCRVTTSDGRTLDKSFIVSVRQQ